ncbi:E3 ubiquitin-protein ligase TRIM39-like [Salminus brasiliensis]|uniref:E3 ubiquitin-protein ligase TRIM39-like n=1 Tax=Salminus brasiliensis TaxID=930266 RepID=UPI003B830700
MVFSKTDYSTGGYHSQGNLMIPHKKKHNRTTNSEPFIKPTLKQLADQLREKIVSQLNAKKSQPHPQQKDFTLDESKDFLRELAAELDKVLQLKKVTLLFGVNNGEISEEESRTVVLQWADELRIQQQNINSVNLQIQADHETSQKLHRVQEAKLTLSAWTWRLNNMQKESVSLRKDYEAMLKDLSKQWKNGHLVNFLAIMDFIIRTMLQDNKSEESIQKQWFKSQQMFKKAGGVYIPVPVWNWITRLQANVTLDPETANSNLLLSEDGKTVRTLTHEESKSSTFKELHRSCSKFDGWTCVQAADGYTTGRHYWEVDVQRKCDWRIGVVKDSAPRRGFVNMNTTAGYWTLRLQLGSLMAMTDPVTRLNQPTPSRIGVYLDIEEGQVSFCDSENRRHIYTFKTDFRSERIYPVFGTVETDRPIRIM